MSNYETSQTSDLKELINKLRDTQTLSKNEWIRLIDGRTPELADYLFENAREVRITHYGHNVYVRGLIEFTNYCRNDCYYCGIRKSNLNAHRYRLTKEEILNCCKTGYELGFRTFVLQGGEDGWFTVSRLADIVSDIHKNWPDCAITLSVGEMEHDAYQTLFDAGADRYLLRHETYDEAHYRMLHPASLSALHRQNCLWDLKSIGYQIGTGFMVGAPFQTTENLADDMLFLKDLNPHMLLPATTALGTISPTGREQGILAGANVVMPNLSPTDVRKDYLLYDNKICTGDESAQCKNCLAQRMESVGYRVVVDRGDSLNK